MITTTYKNEDLDDALWAAQPGSTILLQPERTYYTQGPWQFQDRGHISLRSGCTLVASGATIMLRDSYQNASTGPRIDRDLPILWAGPETKIEGGTWNCNAAGHPGWFTQGIRFFGRFDINAAIITGMRGTRHPNQTKHPVESFAISSEGDTAGSTVVGVRVEDSGGNEPNDYVSGIFVGSTVPWAAGMDSNRVALCDVKLGRFGQFAYSCNGMTVFSDCAGEASRGLYNDTGDTRARLVDCRLTGHYAAISLVGTSNCVRQVAVHRCSLKGERAVEWHEGSGSMDGFVVVTDSTYDAEHAAAIACKPGRSQVAIINSYSLGKGLLTSSPGSPLGIIL